MKTKNATGIIYGSFKNMNEDYKVAVKRRRNRPNFSSEVEILKDFKTCGDNYRSDLLKHFYIHGDNLNPDYIVLEDFGDNLTTFFRFDSSIRGLFVNEILKAVNAVHKLHYMHGDIKPENILISQSTTNASFRCKLCNFETATKFQNPFPRTIKGKLHHSKQWVSPEIFDAYKEEKQLKVRMQIFASSEIDIFSVALIIDLLCYDIIRENETDDHFSKLKKYFANVDELRTLSYCVRINHPYDAYIKEMLSIEPNDRKSADYYLGMLQQYGTTGLYRRLVQKQHELDTKINVKNTLIQVLKTHQSNNKFSSLQFSEIQNHLNNLVSAVATLDEKVDEVLLSTVNNVRTLMDNIKQELKDHMNESLNNALGTIESRLRIIESKDTTSLDGNFRANLLAESNLTLVENLKKNQEITLTQYNELRKGLLDQKQTLDKLSMDSKALVVNGDNLQTKLDAFDNFQKTSDELKEIMKTLSTKEDFNSFCDNYKTFYDKNIQEVLQQVTNKFYGENNEIMKEITKDFEEVNKFIIDAKTATTTTTTTITTTTNTNVDLDSLKEILIVKMDDFNGKMLSQVNQMDGKLGNVRLEIFNQIEGVEKKIQDSIESNIDETKISTDNNVNRIITEIKNIKDAAKMSDEELKKYMDEINHKLDAIRNFQDLSAFDLHSCPLLFTIDKDNQVSYVKNKAGQSYRMCFSCTVCGKKANSGRHKDEKENFSMGGFLWKKDNQPGYPIFVPSRTLVSFLRTLKFILRILEFASKIGNIPVPNLSFLIDDFPLSDTFSKRAMNKFKNFLNFSTNSLTQVNGNVGSNNNTNVSSSSSIQNNNNQIDNFDDDDDDDDESDGLDTDDSDDEIRTKLRLTSQEPYTPEEREAMKEAWIRQRPKVTLEHVKLVKELLLIAGDSEARFTGLRRAYNADEGASAWVCEENPKDANDANKLSCYDLFLQNGQQCCLIDMKLG